MRKSSLLLRLAVQDLGHRPLRAALLVLAVAVGSCAVFTGTVLYRSVQNSLSLSLNRLGADLMVVPRDTTVNLTTALLTVEPTDRTFDSRTARAIAELPGVERAAPQRYFALPSADKHGDEDLIVFDLARDFTVLPWLSQTLDRPFRTGDIIIGGRRPEEVGGVLPLFNQSFPIYGKLALTGIGPFERSMFVTADTAARIGAAAQQATGRPIITALPDRHSAVLIRLKAGARPEQFRFAASRIPEVQVVSGNGLNISVRQAITIVLSGSVVLAALTLLATAVIVGVLYSGILSERQRELGLLMAVGMRPGQLVELILVEAVLTTGIGAICGAILGAGGLMLFQRSVGFLFVSYQVPFALPGASDVVLIGLVTALLCCCAGLTGAALPAARAGRREPYALVRGEGA